MNMYYYFVRYSAYYPKSSEIASMGYLEIACRKQISHISEIQHEFVETIRKTASIPKDIVIMVDFYSLLRIE